MKATTLVLFVCTLQITAFSQYKWEKLPPIPVTEIENIVYGQDEKLYLFTEYDKTYFYVSDDGGVTWDSIRSPEKFVNVYFFDDETQIFESSSKLYKYDDNSDWKIITTTGGSDVTIIDSTIYTINNFTIKTIGNKGDGIEVKYSNPFPNPKWGPYELFKNKDKYYMTGKGGVVKSFIVMNENFDSLNYIPTLPIVSELYFDNDKIYFFNSNSEVVMTDSLFTNFEYKKVKSINGYEFGITSTFIYNNELYIYNTNRIYKHPLYGEIDLDWELVTLDKGFGQYDIAIERGMLLANGHLSGNDTWLLFDINTIETAPDTITTTVSSLNYTKQKILEDGNIIVQTNSGTWSFEKNNDWTPTEICPSTIDENINFSHVKHFTEDGRIVYVSWDKLSTLDIYNCEIEEIKFPKRISFNNSFITNSTLLLFEIKGDSTVIYRSNDLGKSFVEIVINGYSDLTTIKATVTEITLIGQTIEKNNVAIIKIDKDNNIQYFSILENEIAPNIRILYNNLEVCGNDIDVQILTLNRNTSEITQQLYTSNIDSPNFNITNQTLDNSTFFDQLFCVDESTYAIVDLDNIELHSNYLSDIENIPFEEDTNNKLKRQFFLNDNEYIYVSDDNGQIYKVGLGVLSITDYSIYCNYSEQKNTARLNWSINQQDGLYHYEILRKNPTSTTFKNISNGTYLNNQEEQLMEYDDYDLSKDGIYYYKVISYNNNGIEAESKTVSCLVNNSEIPKSIIISELYPNPVLDNLNVRLSTYKDQEIDLEIRNIIGEVVATINNLFIQKGFNTINVKIGEIPTGAYYLSIKSREDMITEKIIISPN